ncbi:restriction endonuclease fold toxin [Actinomadura flavalba]|uniref:restriction endonuclease fold toxin n=1 Tax=Actinomadura flavalba TaxID=1120938 RepID=UPI0012DC03C2|nr:restriction endonuclease fold toxin [Actinomadura flavalba]
MEEVVRRVGRPRLLLGRPGGRARGAVAAALTAVLAVGLVSPVPAQAAPEDGRRFSDSKPVKGHALKPRARKATSAGLTAEAPRTPSWPKPGAAEVKVPAKGTWGRAGELPVWVAEPQPGTSGDRNKAVAKDPARQVAVRILDRKSTQRAGVEGVMLAVSRTDVAAAGQVTVGLSYAQFAAAFGGAHGSRLRLVQYPGCVLTTPDRTECRKATPVSTTHDPKQQTLIAQVRAAAGAPTPSATPGTSPASPTPTASTSAKPSAGATPGTAERPASPNAAAPQAGTNAVTVLATQAGASGSQGDYKATSLTASSTWAVGNNTGEFTWSYPMRVPPVPGGIQPDVKLGYSSGGVDGRTANSNSQSSWAGDGFDLWPGYIERRYKPCEDDGAPKDQHGNSPGDLCWGYDNATLSWNGRGGELVPEGAGKWRLKSDDGTRIERLTNAGVANGDNDNEYWKITTTDGTSYYFGSNKGTDGAKPATGSTWTVPVFGDDANEPCNKSSGFKDSWCQQAWRWNLDYVVDPDGNVITYYYDTEQNHYGRNLKAEDETPYIRGGVLNRIEYGLRSDNLTAKAPAKVVFNSKERCLDTDTNCEPGKIDSNPNLWPDTPYDLNCKSGTECKDFKGTVSPTFWTRKRLDSVKTQVIKSDGTFRDVDSWQLSYRWGTADYDYSLLPISIQHTGHAASAGPITLPKTTFDYEERDNRVAGAATGKFMRYRLDYIADEHGGEVSVAYSTAQCTSTSLPQPETNTKRCFPVYWAHDGGMDPTRDWFHKYVVTHVIARDRTGRTADMVTKYVYDEGTGAAWHYDDDDGLTKEKHKTWSQWRGYKKVSVLKGSDPLNGMVEQTDTYYLRGMHGDRKSATDETQKREVTESDGNGGTVTDEDPYAGRVLRTVQLDQPGGQVLKWSHELPRKFQTASKTRPWGTITANIAVTQYSRTFTPTGTSTWRTAETRTEHEAATGRPLWISDNGDLANSADDRCTRTTYADNTTAWIREPVAQQEVTKGSCLWTGLDRRYDVLSDTRTYYDGTSTTPKSAFKSVTKGRATYSERLVSHAAADGSQPTYQKVSATTEFDEYGRPKTVSDAKNNIVTTAYTQTPATGPGLTTRVVVNKPTVTKTGGSTLKLASTTALDTAWGAPITQTEDADGVAGAAGGKTELFYDALGRLTKVWLPDRNRTGGQTNNLEHSYQIEDGKPVVIGTRTVTNNGALGQPTYQFYDGFLRPRQTQAPGLNNGRVITDTMYDGRGNVAWTYNGYYNDQSAPITTLFGPDMQGLVKSQTRYTYDGAGRTIRSALLNGAGDTAEVFAAAYAYGSDGTGDWVSVTPPDGATPTTTWTNARGKTLRLRQFNATSPTGSNYIDTSYVYDAADRPTKTTGPGGKVWEYTYDARGRATKIIDPDSGIRTSTYDELDRLTSTTDARYTETDKTKGRLFHEYDALGRKTQVRASNSNGEAGNVITAWTYDTARKGQLDTATRKALGADGTTTYDYTSTVNTYDAANRPTRTTITVPAGAEGGLSGTYQFNTAYNPDGTLQSGSMPAAGGLAAEVVSFTYDEFKRPLTMSGLSSYVTGTAYSNLGQIRNYLLAAGGKTVTAGFDYDDATGRTTRATVSREGIAGYDRDAAYTYNDAGNIKRITDITGHATTGGTTTDVQCFGYDRQGRLTDAWTQTATACPATPATAQIAGPAPYRKQYSYHPDGSRTKEESWGAGANGGTWQAKREYKYAGDSGVSTTYKGHQLASYTEQSNVDNQEPLKTHAFTYDAIGNTAQHTMNGSAQKFTWGADNEITRTEDPTNGVSTFVYDADGNRLIRRDKSGNTLYLPGMELRQIGTAASTATRYYSHAGKTVAMRTATGVTLLAGDHHNTSELAIEAGNLTKISRRRTLPFGEDRGGSTGTWPTAMDKGFVGGTKDNTGLTHLGAREYDPATGRFISVDPILDQTDPQSWNGYAYADNNPINASDPSGLMLDHPNSPPGGLYPGDPPSPKPSPGCRRGCWDNSPPAPSPPIRRNPKPSGGGNFFRGVGNGFINTVMMGPKKIAHIGVNAFECAKGDGSSCLQALGSASTGLAFNGREFNFFGGDTDSKAHVTGSVLGGLLVPLPGASAAGSVAKGGRPLAAVAARVLGRCSSFLPGTRVLMADGSRKQIEKIARGEKVLATDVKNGKTEARRVAGAILSRGKKKLVKISVAAKSSRSWATVADSRIRTPGFHLPNDQYLIATDEHPFWIGGSTRRWVPAADVEPGMWLRDAQGQSVQVSSVRTWVVGDQRVHNLTVSDLHTYYAVAGEVPVLVHNCGGMKASAQVRNLVARGKTREAADVHYEDMVRARTGGTSQIINGREVDAVTDDALIQVKRTWTAVNRPKNFLSKSTRRQIAATISSAEEMGVRAEFWFKYGVHSDVRSYIERKGGIVHTGFGD